MSDWKRDIAAKLFRNMTARNLMLEHMMKPPHQQRMRGYKIAQGMAVARRVGYHPVGIELHGKPCRLQSRGHRARRGLGQCR
jgi:hypothetical protein